VSFNLVIRFKMFLGLLQSLLVWNALSQDVSFKLSERMSLGWTFEQQNIRFYFTVIVYLVRNRL